MVLFLRRNSGVRVEHSQTFVIRLCVNAFVADYQGFGNSTSTPNQVRTNARRLRKVGLTRARRGNVAEVQSVSAEDVH